MYGITLECIEMSKFFSIHPDNPQSRLLRQAAHVIVNGGLVVYPTDSGYALGCQLDNKEALKRIQRIRRINEFHNMTLVCRDLSDVGTYARISTAVFRLLKAYTPGPYTFVLNATKEVPRRMLHPSRRTVGLRVPDHAIVLGLLDHVGEPIMSTTLKLPDAEVPLAEPDSIRDLLGKQVDLIIDAGHCSYDPTTIVDLTGEIPKIIREGKGDPAPFQMD